VIDWLTIIAPLAHLEPITGGQVLSLSPDGEVEWKCIRRSTVAGSHSTGLQVRSVTRSADPCSHVEISGNPCKFFQGHNLWGTDDVPSLVVATLRHVASVLEVSVSPADAAAWVAGYVQLARVDVTESFHLANLAEVLAWLRAAEQTAHLAHRGRGQLTKGSTLYFGKNSRRWSLKLYAKGQEIRAKGHGQEAILQLVSAVEWANRTLRAELTIRSMELKRLGLDGLHAWMAKDGVPFEPLELLRSHLGAMTMTTTRTLPDEVMQSLFPAQRTAYLAWVAGNDLRATMSNGSFYRLRTKLLPHGVDIATLLPAEVSNVVPLYRVLEAVPAGIPEWAMGTPLYYEPPLAA
jgi:II/X family phage/plasmid replication protein